MLVAPKCLQNKILSLIDEQIAIAKEGKEAYIGIKINSLTDKVIIEKLVEASMSGVKIDMIIRGISCMVAGITGYTETLQSQVLLVDFLSTQEYIYSERVQI